MQATPDPVAPEDPIVPAISPEEDSGYLVEPEVEVDLDRDEDGLPEMYGGMDGGPLDEPVYDSPNLQLLNDIARDESLPPLVRFIAQGKMGRVAQERLVAMAATFLSKNQVFSNIENTRDFQMVQDDMAYVDKLSTLDFTTYDLSADYLAAKALLYASHNIRLRRSRKALNLRQINTQRSESVSEVAREDAEDRRLRSKIPFLGGAFS